MSLNSNKKQHLLVRVVRDKIELTGFYVDKKISIKFPAKSFENLSNLKKADFEDTISKTLKTNKLTDIEAIIFVSDEIAFSKTINKLTEENISQQTLKFNNEIPYEADNVFIQKFKKDDKLYLLGSNKSLLNRIYTVFEKNNITMSGVFFESALLIYGVMIDTKNDNFTEKLLNDAKLVNFYKTKKPKKSKLSKKTLAILLVLILL